MDIKPIRSLKDQIDAIRPILEYYNLLDVIQIIKFYLKKYNIEEFIMQKSINIYYYFAESAYKIFGNMLSHNNKYLLEELRSYGTLYEKKNEHNKHYIERLYLANNILGFYIEQRKEREDRKKYIRNIPIYK